MKKMYIMFLGMGLLAGCAATHQTEEAGQSIPSQKEIPSVEIVPEPTLVKPVESVKSVESTVSQTPLEQHAQKLEEILKDTEGEVKVSEDQIRLILAGRRVFSINQASIKPSFQPVLARIALELKSYDKTMIQIVGYTDNKGSDESNVALSLRQAEAVSAFLQQQGVSQNRILTDGLGSENPLVSNATSAGREKNRRIEITLINLQ